MRKIEWCLEQKKGIKITEPNKNLSDAYLKKSKKALKSMNLNKQEEDLKEWTAGTAYYARYHIITSLLYLYGIKSEIHDCTIAIVKELFKEKIDEELIDDLERAKDQRIDLQYYTDRIVSDKDFEQNINNAPRFVLEIEKVIETTTEEDINKKREILKNIN